MKKESGERQMNQQNNTVYIFVPFRVSAMELPQLHAAVLQSGAWVQVQDEIKYMLKYVADKIDSRDADNCRCFHYTLAPEAYASVPELARDIRLQTAPHLYQERAVQFAFCIQSIQMYCFSTGVGVLAFQLRFEKNDPYWVSSALYYLKKVSKEKLYICGKTDETAEGVTMLSVAQQLTAPLGEMFEFFFYTNPGTERANVLTYMEVEEKADYKRELYYLRRCYGEGYLYTENTELDEKEIFVSSADLVWGVSPEAAVCLVCPDKGRETFLRTTFYKNFNAQYLFMYVLLLHQKYTLYMLLTQIGLGKKNDLKTLEDYRRELYEFETDFVFSCVTEVEQYQRLYAHMTEAFSLKDMFEDVRAPLVSLGEVRQKEEERTREKRDNKLSYALALFSMISLFSALTDGWALAKHVANAFLHGKGAFSIMCVFAALIAGVFGVVIKTLFDKSEK